MVVGRLVPLHEVAGTFYPLPLQGGVVTIGRRPNCSVVCRDGAVSGTHCVVTCAGTEPPTFEVEDCSTNGTYVNEARLSKGQRAQLGDGDVISLTRLDDDAAAAAADPSRLPVATQFRLELRRARSETPPTAEAPPARALRSASLASQTAPPQRAAGARGGSPLAPAADLARDLLLQEQQSKAKITAELLLVRRRLDEERTQSEATARELRKAKAALEDERSRRAAAQALEKLEADAEQLRQDRRLLAELGPEHRALQEKQDGAEVELCAQEQRAASLEAAQQRLRDELDRVRAEASEAEAQLTEAQASLQAAQDREAGLRARHDEARQLAEAAAQEAERLQRELAGERSAREELSDQATLLHADLERADEGARTAQEAAATASEQQAALEGRLASARAEAEAARASAQQAQRGALQEAERVDTLRAAAERFGDALRAYMDSWVRGLGDDAGACGLPGRGPEATPAGGVGSASQAAAGEESASQEEESASQAAAGEASASQAESASRAPPLALAASAPARPSPTAGSQESVPPAAASPAPGPEAGGDDSAAPESCGPAAAKRSATASVLVLPGLEPGFKRARPS